MTSNETHKDYTVVAYVSPLFARAGGRTCTIMLKPKGRKWCLPSTCKYLLCVLTREAFHPCFGKKKHP